MSKHTHKPILFCLILLLALGLWTLPGPAIVQAQEPATPTPDPTIVALEATVHDLSTQVAYFETEVSINKDAIETQAQKELIPILVTAGVITTAMLLIGIASPILIPKMVLNHQKQKIQDTVNQIFYRVDPIYMPIYLPRTGYQEGKQRLEQLQFRRIRTYTSLSEIRLGSIVIVPAEKIEDIDELERFIKDRKLTADQMAFIVHTPEFIKGADRINKSFGNITLANSIVTVVSHIFAVSRGLVGEALKQEEISSGSK